MDSRPFVLGLCGLPGAGKTTLTRALIRRRPEARVVQYDTYQPLTRLPLPEVEAWFARGGDPNEIDHADLVADLRHEARSRPAGAERPLLIFETPFGRLHRESGAFIDFLVWIATPLDIALSRAVLAAAMAARADPRAEAARGFVDWQIEYLTQYPSVRAMYLTQRERLQPWADLTVDGALPVDDLARLLDDVLRSRLSVP